MPPTLYLARSVMLPAAGSVQMFPPGRQQVTVTRSDTGEPEELDLEIDAATAERLEAARAELQARADAGEGDAPFFDFNHEDREASAWPKRIFWAGDHPTEGGVRAEVEWSAAGEAAVAGKTFRRFSPCFHAEAGRITGAPVNMGGLVNRAAFARIAPLFAKQPDPPTNQTMTEDQIKALQEENAALKQQLAALKAKLEEMTKADAEAAVEAAAKDGRIPTAPELKARWVESIVRDPAAKQLLLAMAPNPALASGSLVKAKAPAEQPEEQSPAALLAKFHETPRADQPAFFRAHRAALIAAREATLR